MSPAPAPPPPAGPGEAVALRPAANPARASAVPTSEEAAWRAAVEAVRATSPRHAASLAQGRLVALRTGEVVLAYRADATFHRSTVTGQSGRAVVERLLTEHLGRPTRLVVDDAATAGAAKSLAEQDAEARAAYEQSTDLTVRGHPAIRAALRILGGELEHIQVLERERTGAPGSDVVDEPPG